MGGVLNRVLVASGKIDVHDIRKVWVCLWIPDGQIQVGYGRIIVEIYSQGLTRRQIYTEEVRIIDTFRAVVEVCAVGYRPGGAVAGVVGLVFILGARRRCFVDYDIARAINRWLGRWRVDTTAVVETISARPSANVARRSKVLTVDVLKAIPATVHNPVFIAATFLW